jgi:hypothetical protein
MKKSLLLVALTSVMALGLTGCGNTPASSSGTTPSTETSQQAGDVPDVTLPEGYKAAYLVKIDWGTLTLPSFASIYMTGCMAQAKDSDGKITATWNTGLDAIEMKAVTGADGWYVGYTADVWNEATYTAALATGVTGQPGEYSLVLGYNSTAVIADSAKGLQWKDDLKSTYCASFAYPSNAKFTYAAGDNTKMVLTNDSFTKVPSKPLDPLKNYTIKVAFSEALPTWEIPHLFGSFNSWKTAYSEEAELEARMTVSSTDRKIWKYTFASIIPDTYQLTMSLDYTLEAKPGQTGFSWVKPDDWQAGNLKYTVAAADSDNYVMDDADALTADLTNTGTLGDPSKVANVKFEITNTGTALAADTKVYIIGNFTGWGDGVALDLGSDGLYTVTIDGMTAGAQEFGVTDGSSWAHKLYDAENNGNLKFTLTAGQDIKVAVSGDMTYFGQTETEHAAEAGTITVTNL